MSEIKFEKLEHIATLAETSGGYTLEVNLVSWNDKEAKDISEDGTRRATRRRELP